MSGNAFSFFFLKKGISKNGLSNGIIICSMHYDNEIRDNFKQQLKCFSSGYYQKSGYNSTFIDNFLGNSQSNVHMTLICISLKVTINYWKESNAMLI